MFENSLKLRFDLNFSGTIVLYGFLPETPSDGLHLTSGLGRFSITAYMSDRSKQLENLGNISIPTDRDELRKQPSLMCKGLTIEIQDASPEQNLLKSLTTKVWTDETRGNMAELVELAYSVSNGIVEYFRNLGQQSWLEPSTPDGFNAQKSLQFVLQELRAKWLDSNNVWQPITVGQKSWMMRHRSLFMDGVDIEEWRRDVGTFVEAFINRGKRAPISDVLIANSLRALDQQNGRLAIVEAVIALEGAVKDILPQVLSGSRSIELDTDLIDELIKEAGLRLTVKVILRANADRLQIDGKDIDLVSSAIEVRNVIVHQKQREVELSQAEEYVFAIRKVIARLRGKTVFRRPQATLEFNFN
jgi:hypothetical protein